MEFDVWTARTQTPELRAQAIRSLQRLAPDSVRSQFAIGEDGGFDIESASFWLTTAPASIAA
jgi:hypothetical protein